MTNSSNQSRNQSSDSMNLFTKPLLFIFPQKPFAVNLFTISLLIPTHLPDIQPTKGWLFAFQSLRKADVIRFVSVGEGVEEKRLDGARD